MAYLSTSADLIQRTYRFLREASATPTKWPSAQVVDYLDEAQAGICADLNYLQSQWFTTTSAGIGRYTLPSDLLAIRHILHKPGKSTTETYSRLRQSSLGSFAKAGEGYDASGTAAYWALGGVAGGGTITLWPAPDASAASGLFVIGNQTPEAIGTSASPLPRHLLPLIPLRAAMLAWEDLGAQDEVVRYRDIYQARLKQWRLVTVDMSPDNTEPRQFGDIDDDFPIVTLSQRGRNTGGPLNW